MRDPVEGWVVRLDGDVYVVKGCEHPLPCYYVVPKVLGGVVVRDPWLPSRLYRWSRCLGSHFHVVCPWEWEEVVDPIEALEALLARGFRDEIVELLASTASNVGLTGSSVYAPWRARDVDIVVYGERDSRRILGALLDLWAEGRVRAPPPGEFRSVRREYGEAEWRQVVAYNPLLFEYRGRVYSVKLVSCTRPSPCRPAERRVVKASVVIDGSGGTPCVIPRVYSGRLLPGGGRIRVYTLRSSLACLPRGVILEGVMILEDVGFERLVPDGGSIRLSMLQA